MYRLLLLLYLPFFVTPAYAGIIENISWVESGDCDRAIGRSGELSRWQVMGYVRKDYPNTVWTNAASARLAVVEEMRRRVERFTKTHQRAPSERESAILWRSPGRVNRPTKGDLEYAAGVAGSKE